MNRTMTKPIAWLTVIVIWLACAAVASSQFRDWKKQAIEATLKRKRPPQVYLLGTAVKLKVESEIVAGRDFTGLLRARLESGLFAQDSRLKPEEAHPQTFIICRITRIDADADKLEPRTTKELQKVGEERDSKTGKMKDKNELRPVTKMYRVVRGGINISYQAKDVKTGSVLDAQNILDSYSHDFLEGKGAPSAHEVRESLINSAVDKIVLRLAVTAEEIKVMLPRGKSENHSKLGQAGLWEKMYEGLDKMGELSKQEDEAYRRFGLGIADEAKAYATADPKSTWDHLMEASSHYNKAIELKPDEKYFRDPLKRIEQAIEQYRKLAEQKDDYAKSLRKPDPPPPSAESGSKSLPVKSMPPPTTPSPATPAATARGAAMTNQHVIDLVKSGLDEANLIATIKGERAVAFDLSAAGIKELRDNQVPNNALTAMRARQNAKPTTSRRKK